MNDHKPSTEPVPADPHGAARLVQQFLASFKRRVHPQPPVGGAPEDKPLHATTGRGRTTG